MYKNTRLTQYGIIASEHLDEVCTQALQDIMLGEIIDEDSDVRIDHPERTYRELVSTLETQNGATNVLNYVKKKDGVDYNVIPFFSRISYAGMTEEEQAGAALFVENLLNPYITLLDKLTEWNWDIVEPS